MGRAGRARRSCAAPTSRRPASPSTRRCSGGGMTTRRPVPDDGPRRRGGEIAPIGVGMLGYAFMGKAHSNGYRTLSYMAWPPPLRAAARGDRGPQRGGRRRGGAPLRLRARTSPTGASWSPTREVGAVRQRRPEQPPRRADDRRRRGRQARRLREAARPRRRRVVRDLAARRRRPASCTCARSTTASSRPCGSRAS